MLTTIEVSERDVFRELKLERSKDWALRLFYERAGICAEPITSDAILWQRHDWRHAYVAYADIPSPEFLLV